MKGQAKKLKKLQEQKDRLSQFDQEEDHYEEKDIGGEFWIKSYNGGTKRWQVGVYSPESYRKYKAYSKPKSCYYK